jgi:uncharacterized membrane protein YfcA
MLLLALAAFGAGVMNALAGGGSFLTFPALVFTGVPSVVANASSTVALCPGAFASAWAYRRDFRRVEGVAFGPMLAVSLVGGGVGALLLLFTPQRTFDVVIPWLLAFATVIFACGPKLAPMLRRHFRIGSGALLAGQFLAAVYGGYFGGAVGIVQLALFSVYGMPDIRAMNALKTLLSGAMNGVAVVCFVVAGKVWWPQTLVMLVAAVAGGYLGARAARKLDPRLVRLSIIAISAVITVLFFRRI